MSISRRSFLKGAAAASLAVAASTVLAGCNVSGVTGGSNVVISGSKVGNFTINSKTATVTLNKAQYVDVYDELVLDLSISNPFDTPVVLSKTKSNAGKRVIVPTVTYVGVSGKSFTVDTSSKSTIYNKEVATGKTETGVLVLKPEEDLEWTAVKLTLTLVNGDDQKDVADVEPVTFTIKK